MNVALLTAGGLGSRMGQEIPKQFMLIDDCPVIVYTMLPFQNHPDIDAIAVVCLSGWEDEMERLAKRYQITKLKYIFLGGETNQDSIHNGLVGLQENGMQDDDLVMIQDGVRPLVSQDIISRNIAVAREYGYAVTGLPCKEVIMEYHPADETLSYMPIPRERLIRTQTPHTYKFGNLMRVHGMAQEQNLNKAASCELTACLNINDQHLVLGSEKNGLKLTNVEDIELFKALKQVSDIVTNVSERS